MGSFPPTCHRNSMFLVGREKTGRGYWQSQLAKPPENRMAKCLSSGSTCDAYISLGFLKWMELWRVKCHRSWEDFAQRKWADVVLVAPCSANTLAKAGLLWGDHGGSGDELQNVPQKVGDSPICSSLLGRDARPRRSTQYV